MSQRPRPGGPTPQFVDIAAGIFSRRGTAPPRCAGQLAFPRRRRHAPPRLAKPSQPQAQRLLNRALRAPCGMSREPEPKSKTGQSSGRAPPRMAAISRLCGCANWFVVIAAAAGESPEITARPRAVSPAACCRFHWTQRVAMRNNVATAVRRLCLGRIG